MIDASLSELFEDVTTQGGAAQVLTPMLYPDGGVVDVYIEKALYDYLVTDYGDALSWLLMQSDSGKLSPTQGSRLDEILLAQGVEMANGELQLRCGDPGSLGEAVQRVAQTVVLISGLHSEESLQRRGALEARPC